MVSKKLLLQFFAYVIIIRLDFMHSRESCLLVYSPFWDSDGRIDDRSFWINYVSNLSTPLTIPLVYLRMRAIHNLDEKV